MFCSFPEAQEIWYQRVYVTLTKPQRLSPNETVKFDKVLVDTWQLSTGGYDEKTGTYITPEDGFYIFFCYFRVQNGRSLRLKIT